MATDSLLVSAIHGKKAMNEKYQVQLLKDTPLFDAEWYLSHHSDVESIKLTPELHYLRYGWRMGRSPSALFCSVSYQKKYPDVAQSNENPLIHYLRFGRREGREVQPVRQSNWNMKNDKSVNILKYRAKNFENDTDNIVESQLKETQCLLEKYVRRCQELEYQIIDEKG
ncbi:hypothetical protein ACJJH9_03180 [Microbulbifer sp. DLAB2-AF]|uniref:hypothetical protein n=1 Tax=Microbulbifer sp. DLAB2-AF TaxID=3243395 RepID=UPI0040397998